MLHARVEAADDSLEFSEFLDQFRGEIGLRQKRGLVDFSRANRHFTLLHCLGQRTGQVLYAHRLVEVAAQIFLEGHVGSR